MKRFILSLFVMAGVLFALAAPVHAGTDVFNEACKNPSSGGSAVCTGVSNKDPITGKNGVLFRIARIIAIVAGIAAVIMFIVGGFMLVTSGGDPGKTATGRNTMIYAGVGLLVIALGQAIITLFVNAID